MAQVRRCEWEIILGVQADERSRNSGLSLLGPQRDALRRFRDNHGHRYHPKASGDVKRARHPIYK